MNTPQRIVTVMLLFLWPAFAIAQRNNKPQGTWELISQKVDGQDHPIAGRQIKLLTKTHYAWFRQDRKRIGELLAKGTQRDSITALEDTYGAGTYQIKGDTYTETTEFSSAPEYFDTSVKFRFSIDGDRWYTTGHFWHYRRGKRIDDHLLGQVFRRID